MLSSVLQLILVVGVTLKECIYVKDKHFVQYFYVMEWNIINISNEKESPLYSMQLLMVYNAVAS